MYLSRLEFDLLAVLLSPPGQVRTREELIDQLWAGRELTDTRTLDTHVRRLRVKLEERAREAPLPAHSAWGRLQVRSRGQACPEGLRVDGFHPVVHRRLHGVHLGRVPCPRLPADPPGWWAAAGKGLRCAPPQASPFGGERPPSRARSPPTPRERTASWATFS